MLAELAQLLPAILVDKLAVRVRSQKRTIVERVDAALVRILELDAPVLDVVRVEIGNGIGDNSNNLARQTINQPIGN